MTNQLESNNLSSLQWYNKDHIAKPFVSFNSEHLYLLTLQPNLFSRLMSLLLTMKKMMKSA